MSSLKMLRHKLTSNALVVMPEATEDLYILLQKNS